MKLYSWKLFYLKSCCQGKLRSNFLNLKFRYFKWPRNLRWRNNQNKSFRSQKVMKFCWLQHFYLNLFMASNNNFLLFLFFFVSNCDFWNWAKILLLAQTAQSFITLAKLAGPYISSHLDIYICCFYIYMLFLVNIWIDICIRPSPNPIHTVFDTHYSYL